jgi:hypothetical protein
LVLTIVSLLSKNSFAGVLINTKVIGQTRIPAWITKRYFQEKKFDVMAVIPYPKNIPRGTPN